MRLCHPKPGPCHGLSQKLCTIIFVYYRIQQLNLQSVENENLSDSLMHGKLTVYSVGGTMSGVSRFVQFTTSVKYAGSHDCPWYLTITLRCPGAGYSVAAMATSFSYLAVIKASYDYEPQSEDEIAIKEDQILFLLEKTDEE